MRLGVYDPEADDGVSSRDQLAAWMYSRTLELHSWKDRYLFVRVARGGLLELRVARTRSRASLSTAKAVGAFGEQIDWLRGGMNRRLRRGSGD